MLCMFFLTTLFKIQNIFSFIYLLSRYQDLRRDSFLTEVAEIASVIQEIDLAATKLDEWMAGDTSISVPLVHKPGKAFVMREPLGVVLIIAPFNYPLRLLLLPLIGAIAAGNAALLKPSEISGQTARAFHRILPKYGENTSFFSILVFSFLIVLFCFVLFLFILKILGSRFILCCGWRGFSND